jgi:hypothetical protein
MEDATTTTTANHYPSLNALFYFAGPCFVSLAGGLTQFCLSECFFFFSLFSAVHNNTISLNVLLLLLNAHACLTTRRSSSSHTLG